MTDIDYRRERVHFDDGAWSTVHRVDIPADQLKFEDLHPMSSYVRQQDIARMHYARALARGESSPHILTWTAMQTDRQASQLLPDVDRATDDGEQIISANSLITFVLRKLLTEGWLQLHEYISDTYEWQVEIPHDQSTWRARAETVLRWLEDEIQLDLYPNIERGTYQPRVFRPFDVKHNFVRIGRCDFIRHFVQNHERRVLFNTSHFLHEHDDLISHHSGYGDAIGLMVAANTILRPPIYRRGALLYDGERWRIEPISLDQIELLLPGDIALNAEANAAYRFCVNPDQAEPIALYTRAGGLRQSGEPWQRTPAAEDRTEFTVVNRQIVSWKRGGALQIPQNGFVISLADSALPAVVADQMIEDAWVEYSFAETVGRVVSAIQAGPILLSSANANDDLASEPEEFFASLNGRPGISPVRMDLVGAGERKARTAIGIKADGSLVLLQVDGCENASRTGFDSAGASLQELTDLIRQAGAVDALNLSGEGSSHLFVYGGLANTPSDRRGRPGVVFERMLPSIGIVS